MNHRALGCCAVVIGFTCALAACGGSDNDSPSPTPSAYKLNITKTADVPGTFTGEVDPHDARNAIIQDLALAPLNANGKVEYTADFVLFKPKDMTKSNGVLRYDAPNRGNIVNLDPYFASRGYVFLTSAWQGEVRNT